MVKMIHIRRIHLTLEILVVTVKQQNIINVYQTTQSFGSYESYKIFLILTMKAMSISRYEENLNKPDFILVLRVVPNQRHEFKKDSEITEADTFGYRQV